MGRELVDIRTDFVCFGRQTLAILRESFGRLPATMALIRPAAAH
jgi:hypothetical protein